MDIVSGPRVPPVEVPSGLVTKVVPGWYFANT